MAGAQVMQPVQGGGGANCPPGLEYLAVIDRLLVKQQVEILEALIGFETGNKYEVVNSVGQRAYFAVEDTDCCTRQCCGVDRPFTIKILDNQGRPVMEVHRPYRCSTCWCPCCLQVLTVEAPPGRIIGYFKQKWSVCGPKYQVLNDQGNEVLNVEGPCCTCSGCGDVEFKVLAQNGTQVGSIFKQWSGILKEALTDADNFGIAFPMDLDVKVKATLLGAVFLIDFMFFEDGANKQTDAPGMVLG